MGLCLGSQSLLAAWSFGVGGTKEKFLLLEITGSGTGLGFYVACCPLLILLYFYFYFFILFSRFGSRKACGLDISVSVSTGVNARKAWLAQTSPIFAQLMKTSHLEDHGIRVFAVKLNLSYRNP